MGRLVLERFVFVTTLARRRTGILTFGFSLSWLTFCPTAGGQPASSGCLENASARAGRYFGAVRLYRLGEFEAAHRALGHLSIGGVARLVHSFESKPSSQLPSEDCLRAAALLHTEYAMGMEGSGGGFEAPLHWQAARSLIDRIQDVSRREAFRRNWLLLAAYYYQSAIFTGSTSAHFDRARRYFDEAVASFPDDAGVLVSAGALYEWNGSLPLGGKGNLTKAENLYRGAVASDPRSAEARLRLGRVLEKLDRFAEAQVPLRQVLELDEDGLFAYFAHFLLGRHSEREGNLDEAIHHYREGRALRPHWQVGHIALAHALHTRGAHREARAVVSRAVTLLAPFAQFDGWWIYERGRSDRFWLLLDQLREEVGL